MKKTPVWFILILALSFLGFMDAVYLSAKHYTASPVNCSILNGCDKVLTSDYATLGSIPVAILGVIYYFSIFLLANRGLFQGNHYPPPSIFWLSTLGLSMSLWFVYLQAFVLKAFCLYCMFSALISTALFLITLLARFRTRAVAGRPEIP